MIRAKLNNIDNLTAKIESFSYSINNHSKLNNLDFDSSGHTGFASEKSLLAKLDADKANHFIVEDLVLEQDNLLTIKYKNLKSQEIKNKNISILNYTAGDGILIRDNIISIKEISTDNIIQGKQELILDAGKSK